MKFFRGVSLAKGSQLRILFLLAGILLVTLAIQAFMIKEGFEEMGEAVVERQPVRSLTKEQQRMSEQQEQNTRDLEFLIQENESSISTDERQDKAIRDIKNATFKMIPERKRRSRLDDAASSYNA